MKVHLIDGTFELFRAFFGAPQVALPDGREVGATRGILRSLSAMLRGEEMTHVGVAFDTVIESFRNDLFDGYKTGAGLPEELTSQVPLSERAAEALGLVTWRMIEFEADDAIASAAAMAEADARVEEVVIVSPDKDFAQCVRGSRVVCLDRQRRRRMDEAGVMEKFGVGPGSIPDYLALVGDDADGIPGLPGWGAKGTAAVLARYGRIEDVPDEVARWDVKVRGAAGLASALAGARDQAALYRRLATLREDAPLGVSGVDGLAWRGARRELLEALCREIGDLGFLETVQRWA